MRSIIALTCCAAMAACATPPAPQPDSAQPDNPQAIAAAFQMPMDPSLISCGALINVNALNAATEWTMGRAPPSCQAKAQPCRMRPRFLLI